MAANQMAAYEHQPSHYLENIRRLATLIEAKYPGRGVIDSGAHAGEAAAALSFADLGGILARDPRFQSSKLVQVAGRDLRKEIPNDEWERILVARPVLFWKGGSFDEAEADSQDELFNHLKEAGYGATLVFDGRGEFVQTISFEARQQIVELSEYLGHEEWGFCAFHQEDLDLSERFRECERENRPIRREHVLPHGSDTFPTRSQLAEMPAVRAHIEFDRHRMQHQIAELETQLALKGEEIERLHGTLREFVRSEDLKAQVTVLRHELDTSLALRAARSLHWILGPIRRLLKGRSDSGSA